MKWTVTDVNGHHHDLVTLCSFALGVLVMHFLQKLHICTSDVLCCGAATIYVLAEELSSVLQSVFRLSVSVRCHLYYTVFQKNVHLFIFQITLSKIN